MEDTREREVKREKCKSVTVVIVSGYHRFGIVKKRDHFVCNHFDNRWYIMQFFFFQVGGAGRSITCQRVIRTIFFDVGCGGRFSGR